MRAGRLLGISAFGLALVAAGCSSTPAPTSTATSTTRAATSTTIASVTTTQPASPGAAWTTYQGDAARRGDDATAPAASTLQQRWQATLDGQLYTQPLVVGSQVLAATENDTVYALNAASGAVEWSAHLGTPMRGSQLPCGNVNPSGITGTPVVDPASGLLYVVVFVQPGVHQLVALALHDGAVASRQSIDLPGVDALAEQQRGALTLVGGRVYVPFGGLYGDCGNYRGFVVSFPTSGSGQETFAVPTTREGAIWAPPGPVSDGTDLYVTTGNGASQQSLDGGDTVFALNTSLHDVSSFTPTNWKNLNATDTDLGSVSPTLVGTGDVFQVGKGGIGYLLDRSNLGGVGGYRYSAPVCSGGAYGGTAVDGASVFVPCKDGLVDLAVSVSKFSVRWRAASLNAGTPVVAGGAVFALTSSGSLVELDEASGRVVVELSVPKSSTSFPALAAVGADLYAAAGSQVVAFGGA